MTSGNKLAPKELYAMAFGLFLGLCILKFGNPVILDQKISTPASPAEYWSDFWPIHWANWIFLPLAAVGLLLFFNAPKESSPRRCPRRLLILPLLWLGWQWISAVRTVDAELTATTLWQFFGCVACYFIGAFLFRNPRALNLLLAGILAGFTICLIRSIHQRFEFPQDKKFLMEGQSMGWTNLPPQTLLELKRDQTIITTNGVDVANPAIVAKFAKGRVMGTLVYPNALAGLILLLFPVGLVLAFHAKRQLRPAVGGALLAITVGLSAASFFWSGSKFGWLIALALAGLCLFRLRWPVKLKILLLASVAVLGLGLFFIRFHTYFAHGAASAVARLDYWRAAVQTTRAHPMMGTGPGTFQRPYAQLKSPDAEMARLAHNDYLEQFSDSGIIGGVLYCAWIIAGIIYVGKNVWHTPNLEAFAIFLGLLAWFVQGLGEFGLYIPALAWTAFVLLGCALRFEKGADGRDKGSPPP